MAGNAILLAAFLQAYRAASELALETTGTQVVAAPDQALHAARATLVTLTEQLDDLTG